MKDTVSNVNELCITTNNYVCMKNDLLLGKSSLTPTQAKLIRTAIMQVKVDDKSIGAYSIKAKELADILHISTTNYSRDLKKACKELASKTVSVDKHNGKEQWEVWPWFAYIKYSEDAIVTVQLNHYLAPYLLELKKSGQYTQYVLENILSMNSVFAIRIYEYLKMKLPNNHLPNDQYSILVENKVIRQITNTEDTLKQNCHFKERLLDVAVKEINEKSDIKVEYYQRKLKGRSYDHVEFICRNPNQYIINSLEKQIRLKFVKYNQMRLEKGKSSLGSFNSFTKDRTFKDIEEFDNYVIEYMMDNPT